VVGDLVAYVVILLNLRKRRCKWILRMPVWGSATAASLRGRSRATIGRESERGKAKRKGVGSRCPEISRVASEGSTDISKVTCHSSRGDNEEVVVGT
jgi:hypothetical protein